MVKALIFSFLLHGFLIGALIWSTQISLLFIKSRTKNMDSLGVVQVDLLYKPTETKVRKGESPQELPPPKVKTKASVEPDPAPVVKVPPKKKPQPKPKKEEPKKDFAALFNKMRQDTGEELRRAPREDNFLKRKDGEENSFGTGGTASQELSPALLAFQTAVRSHFEMPEKDRFVRNHPNTKSFMSVKLMGVGGGFELVSLRTTQSSGFPLFDQNCEAAVRRAVEKEAFAKDIVAELSGKETVLSCQP